MAGREMLTGFLEGGRAQGNEHRAQKSALLWGRWGGGAESGEVFRALSCLWKEVDSNRENLGIDLPVWMEHKRDG